MHGGVVKSILVSEGQKVVKGQLLLELDDTNLVQELKILKKKLESIDLKIIRYKTLLSENFFPDNKVGFDNEDYNLEKDLYISEFASKKIQIQLLEKTLEEAIEQKEVIKKTLYKNQLELEQNSLNERSYKTLSEQHVIPTKKYRDIKYQKELSKKDCEISKSNFLMQEKKIESIKAKIDNLIHGFKEKYNQSLRDLLDYRNEVEEQILKIEHNIELMKIKSCVNGSVEDIEHKTIGGVISPNSNIMKIIPDNVELEVQTYLNNLDIGFIKLNQDVAIKLDTYPYTVYCTLKGKIIKIADNAKFDKFKCIVKITFSNTPINRMKLSSGMTGNVDIYTDKRRLIFYFIDPIRKSFIESFHER